MNGKHSTFNQSFYALAIASALAIGGWHSTAWSADGSPEYQVTEGQVSDAPKARNLINTFLESKKWSEGENVNTNGSKFFVAVGVGVINGRRDSSNYVTSRDIGFRKAFLDAQKSMAQFLEADVSASLSSSYAEPTAAREQARIDELTRDGMAMQAAKNQVAALNADIQEHARYKSESTAANEAQRLLNAEINSRLKKAGFDPNKPVEQQELQKILMSSEFKSAMRVVANTRLAGMQVFKSFEVLPEGNQGEIGVVAIYSEKLHALANAMFSGQLNLVPIGMPKDKLINQIPKDPKVLLPTFGVTAKMDENGQLALIGYGQAGARSDSTNAINAAAKKARLAAIEQIRFFAGAMAKTMEDKGASESMKELANKNIDVVTDDSYAEKIEVFAKSLKINGIQQIHTWNIKHPLTGHYIAGSVVAWKPSSAAVAISTKNKLDSVPLANQGASAAKRPTVPALKPENAKKGAHTADGAEGSNDF